MDYAETSGTKDTVKVLHSAALVGGLWSFVAHVLILVLTQKLIVSDAKPLLHILNRFSSQTYLLASDASLAS